MTNLTNVVFPSIDFKQGGSINASLDSSPEFRKMNLEGESWWAFRSFRLENQLGAEVNYMIDKYFGGPGIRKVKFQGKKHKLSMRDNIIRALSEMGESLAKDLNVQEDIPVDDRNEALASKMKDLEGKSSKKDIDNFNKINFYLTAFNRLKILQAPTSDQDNKKDYKVVAAKLRMKDGKMQGQFKKAKHVKQAILQVAKGVPKPKVIKVTIDQSLKEPEELAHLKAAKEAKKSVEDGSNVKVEIYLDGKVLNYEKLDKEIAKRESKKGTMVEVEGDGPKSGPMQNTERVAVVGRNGPKSGSMQKTGKILKGIRSAIKDHNRGNNLSIAETKSYIKYIQGESKEISQSSPPDAAKEAEIKKLFIGLKNIEANLNRGAADPIYGSAVISTALDQAVPAATGHSSYNPPAVVGGDIQEASGRASQGLANAAGGEGLYDEFTPVASAAAAVRTMSPSRPGEGT